MAAFNTTDDILQVYDDWMIARDLKGFKNTLLESMRAVQQEAERRGGNRSPGIRDAIDKISRLIRVSNAPIPAINSILVHNQDRDLVVQLRMSVNYYQTQLEARFAALRNLLEYTQNQLTRVTQARAVIAAISPQVPVNSEISLAFQQAIQNNDHETVEKLASHLSQ